MCVLLDAEDAKGRGLRSLVTTLLYVLICDRQLQLRRVFDVFGRSHAGCDVDKECYLVDPASSHMLVSKIKPCMCKYELFQTVKLRMAH